MAVPDLFQKRSFSLAVRILRLYRQLVGSSDVPRHLAHQMLRSGTSIAANLAESKSAYSRRDLAARQTVALRETRECHCWLRLIATDQPAMTSTIDPVVSECDQLIAMLTASVRKLRSGPGL
jgi:four helix bundle protein